MKTALGTVCNGTHTSLDGVYAPEAFRIKKLDGEGIVPDRAVAVCQHRIGTGHCGALIDVTRGQPVSACCGIDTNHERDIVNPLA